MKSVLSIIDRNIKLKLLALTFVIAISSYVSSLVAVKTGGLYDDISSGKIASIEQGLMPVLLFGLLCVLSAGLGMFKWLMLELILLQNEVSLKSKSAKKILKSKVSYHTECLSGERSSQVSGGVYAMWSCMRMVVHEMLFTCFLVVFSLYQLLKIAPIQMTLVTLVYMVIFTVATILNVIYMKEPRKRANDLANEFVGKTAEAIQNIEFIRALNAFNYEQNRLDKNIKDGYKSDKKVTYLWAIFDSAKNLVRILSLLTLILLSCYFIGKGTLKPGSAIAVCLLFDKILNATWPISYLISNFSSNLIEAKKLVELLNNEEDETLKEKSSSDELESSASTFASNLIEFKDTLVLAPNGDKVIGKYNNIKIDTRKITALKGVTGAGKTTLIRALLRYYPSNTDNILVFGKPLSQYSHKELTDKIYYVTQNAFFFHGTIRDNLIYGLDKDVDDLKLISVLKKMCLVSDINHSEKGQEIESEDKILDYKLQEGASNLSGGQRQRLSIARALLKSPHLFIFDESSANIDSVTADLVLTNIESYASSIGAGIVYISHDESVRARCNNEIIVQNEAFPQAAVNF